MRYTSLLPPRVQLGLRRLRQDWWSARQAWSSALRPVYSQRSTEQARARAPQRPRELDLVVHQLTWQTPDALTVTLANDPAQPLRPLPGQFVTLITHLQGREQRRPYSICSDPALHQTLSVTIKRVPGGLVSNHLCDTLRPGDVLRVFGPGGRFGADLPWDEAPLVLVGGGSGITPLMSLLRSALRQAPQAPVWLIYANRSAQDVIFAQELAELARRHPELTLTQVWERGPGALGRLTGPVVERCVPALPQARYLVCGPAPMMEAVRHSLLARGVSAGRIQQERFSPPPPPAALDSAAPGQRWPLRVEPLGVTVQVEPGQTLLDAGRAAGLPMRFSCAMGGCGACKVKLLQGQVEMPGPHCLSDQEQQEGACLACVARPLGPVVLHVQGE